MSCPAIVCDNLSRWYGEVQGLAGLSVTLNQGVFGLLGPNGSGKSTLMRLLTGQIHASRGSVKIFGETMVPGNYQALRHIGYAVGEDVHFENERAVDFMKMLAVLGGENPIAAESRALKALDFMGMSDKAGVRLREMSKGMRQRIKVAQALLFEPDLLLLDEPLNGMDPVNRRHTINRVRQWGESGRTVLLASHVLHEVESVTDRLIMLHHGRLLAEGHLSDIRELVDRKPRRASIKGENLRQLIAELLGDELITGFTQDIDGCFHLDTFDLPLLLEKLSVFGRTGVIETLETDDQELELVYSLLLSDNA
ncbi:MAG: ABC transporter ATP-binding protein [Planctomycetes bacterium]|nr:ABC transporter ATP-binding protein [Planctomycetota bacterium]